MHLSRRTASLALSVVLPLMSLAVVVGPAQATTPVGNAADIRISEVYANGGKVTGGPAHDFIELTNTGSSAEDISGWVLKDDTDSHNWTLDPGTVVPAGGYLAVSVDDTTHAGNFGLGGGGDAARLYLPNGTTLVDELYWTTASADLADGWSRCASAHGGAGAVEAPATPGAANNCPAAAAVATTLLGQLKVNEVMADNASDTSSVQLPDWIELTNTGSTTVDASGWILSDNKASDKDVLPAGSFIAPHGYLAYAVGVAAGDPYAGQDPFIGVAGNTDFGLGKGGDNAALEFPDGTDVDRYSWSAAWTHAATEGRCPDGGSAFQVTFTPTEGAANACGNTADGTVKLNEVDAAHGVIELTNTGSASADTSGWLIKDGGGTVFTIPAGSTIAAGAFATYDVSGAFTFAPAGDSVTLLDGSTQVDTTTFTGTPVTSWGRCPDGTGSFATTTAVTPDAANSCGPPAASGYAAIRINEIETNGDPNGDAIELANIGGSAVDVSGMIFKDNDDTDGYAIPTGTSIAAGGFLKLSVASFVFGLGADDMARLFAPNGTTLVDSDHWTVHEAGVTYQRCPGATQGVVFTNAEGEPMVNSWVSTLGAANDCRPPIRINEVQASDPTGGPDWVELTNIGNAPYDISNWLISDDKDSDTFTIPAGTTLQPGAFVTYDQTAFGLGATGDEMRLFLPGANAGGTYDASDLVDSFVWETPKQSYVTQNATGFTGTWPANATYGRCPDGVGAFVVNTPAAASVSPGTKGSANSCAGVITPKAWPGPQAVSAADNVDFGQNLSGLFYVPGATPAQDFIWGIANGDSGLPGSTGQSGLYKIVKDGNGLWGPAAGYAKGLPIHYTNGLGQPDAEGVTAIGGQVFVASERDNAHDNTSKVAILQYDPSASSGGLTATREWDLQSDLGLGTDANLDPTQDANLGAEGVAYVPDSYLTGAGFVDQSTGAAYDPSRYGDHLGGVFFVALEKTGNLYAYVLKTDGTFHRVATVATGFPTIMDAAWDPSQDALWVDCDNSCQGQTSILKLDTTTGDAQQGKFVVTDIYNRPTGAVDNLNNEGFTFQPSTECDPTTSTKSVWWSDDSDDGGHALRTAKVNCTAVPAGKTGAGISAAVSSTGTLSPGGWYAAPATVTFTCTTTDGVLASACPAPVNLTNGSALTATGSITDTLGKTYSVTSAPVSVDTVKPTVAITGVAAGATYAGVGPMPACTASDALSGLAAACRISVVRTPTTVTVTATATDKAGNAATATLGYHTLAISFTGATQVNGIWQVKWGTSYPLVVLTTDATAPRYVAPGLLGILFGIGTPMQAAGVVDGVHVWTLRVYPIRLLNLFGGVDESTVREGSQAITIRAQSR